jgi:hypothetical protein
MHQALLLGLGLGLITRSLKKFCMDQLIYYNIKTLLCFNVIL